MCHRTLPPVGVVVTSEKDVFVMSKRIHGRFSLCPRFTNGTLLLLTVDRPCLVIHVERKWRDLDTSKKMERKLMSHTVNIIVVGGVQYRSVKQMGCIRFKWSLVCRKHIWHVKYIKNKLLCFKGMDILYVLFLCVLSLVPAHNWSGTGRNSILLVKM